MFSWFKKTTRTPDDSAARKALGDRYSEEGKLDDAAASYRQAIAIRADFAEAYNNLGNILRAQHLPADAEQCFKQAIAINPALAQAYFNLGYLSQEQGRLNDAIDNFKQGLRREPDTAIVYRDLGYALFQAGQLAAAKQAFAQGIALDPGIADLHFFMGNLHNHEQAPDDAIACYRRALSIQTDHAAARANLGKLLLAAERLHEAMDAFNAAPVPTRAFALPYYQLGIAFQSQGAMDDALHCLRKAFALQPESAALLYNLGIALKSFGQLRDAMACYRGATELKPDFIDAHCNLGNLYFALGELDAASACHQRVLAMAPDSVKALYGLGSVLGAQQKIQEAVRCFHHALALEPGHLAARTLLLYHLQHMCAWDDLDTHIAAIRHAVTDHTGSAQNRLSPLAFVAIPGATAKEQKQCAEQWVRGGMASLLQQRARLGFQYHRASGDKISIGYLSADFRQHPVSFLMAEVLELHDRARFHVTAYSYGPDDGSAMRGRIQRACDAFVDIRNDDYEGAAKKIHADQIDILVDLTGHTQDSRTDILALRPAPIQVNYLGYPGTMGADFIDYLIADRFIVPPQSRQHYTEQVAWLPDCFQANDRTRPRPATPGRAACGLPEDGFVFCCFNQTAKITPEVFDIWCRLLRAVPGSVLWLPASNRHAGGNLRREAEQRGIDSSQLIMAPLMHRDEHLARLQCADLFLDTLPFNAGTTCSDALWMGLPVITCAGDAFASRMAGSLLTSIGTPELITYTLDDYYELALKLATSTELLAGLRQKISANRDTAPLFDSPRFTRNLEEAYRQMVRARARGED